MSAINIPQSKSMQSATSIEGPKKHIIAFIFSILLTIIAFATGCGGEINTTFIYIILVRYGDYSSIHSDGILDAYERSRTCFPDHRHFDGRVRRIHDCHHGRILGLVVIRS